MIILGCDPGISGAFALLEDRRILHLWDMPVHKITTATSSKNKIDHVGMADIFSGFELLLAAIGISEPITKVFIEQVGVRPGEGAVGAFSFGLGYGSIIQAIADQRLSYGFLSPRTWQKTVRLASGADDNALAMAKQTWPDALGPDGKPAFGLKKHVGRADAALIALAGWKIERGDK